MNQKKIITLLLLLAGMKTGLSQGTQESETPRKHNIVMQVTQSDSLTQLAVIGQIRNIKRTLPGANIEVVCHANALDLVLKGGSKVKQHVTELSLTGVHFIACENTMARKKLTANDLLAEIETVPSGLVEIILKQEEGWSYIKGGY